VAAHAEVWTELEESLGRLTLEQILAQEGRISDPLLQAWVDRVGGDVCRNSSREHLRYHFYISGSSVSNACSLPGGYVVVTSGLLNHVSSDEELAGVIAHEIAHSDDRDFARTLREQALFFGAQSIARGTWTVARQILQALQGMRSSRRHEAQADYQGARLCLLAAYDPSGLADFLETITGRPHGIEKLLASHPPGPDRVVATRRRIDELQRSQCAQMVALAEGLERRNHLKRAAKIAATAAEHFPSEPEPRAVLARIEDRREAPGQGQPVALPDGLQAEVMSSLDGMRRDWQALQQAGKALRPNLASLYSDRRIATALQYAQAFEPEPAGSAPLTTPLRAYRVLSRAQQEAQRQTEVSARAASVRLGWERVAAELTANKVTVPATANSLDTQRAELQQSARVFLAEARPAVQAATVHVSESAARCRELTAATRMLSAAFLTLLAAEDQQQLGRMSYPRFLLVQGDILAAEQRIRRSEQASETGQRTILDQHLRVLQEALTAAHATAGPALREVDLALVAVRVGSTPTELAACPKPFGEAAMTLLEPRVQAKALAGLKVKDCLLRIAYLDVVAER